MPTPSLPILLAAGLACGTAGGVALERAGVVSPIAEPEPAAVRLDRVQVLDCPDGVAVAGLTRGDRVLATGRTDDGAWIEIRSPVERNQAAWMAAGVLAGDRSLDDLPVHDCDRAEGPTTTSSTSTSTTTTSTTSTSTTRPVTTTQPPTTQPRPATTTSTVPPPDTTPPQLANIARSVAGIFEAEASNPPSCTGTEPLPVTAVISVVATDDRPGVTVSMTYSFTGLLGPRTGPLSSPSQQGSNYSGVLGHFDPGHNLPSGNGVPITVTVNANDAAGNVAAPLSINVLLRPCP